MTVARIYRRFDSDLEDGLRILGALADIERRMAARLPSALDAAVYDTTGGGTVAWCDIHEREVTACRRHKLLCRGVPLPRVTDPTGDLVVHPVLVDAQEMDDAAAMVHEGIKRMLLVAHRYGRDEDPAADSIAETVEEANRPKCQVHMRYGWVIDARGKHPTRVTHRGVELLETPVRLCEKCEKLVRAAYAELGERRLPYRSEVDRHARRNSLPRCNVPAPAGDQDDAEQYAHVSHLTFAS